MSEKDYIDGLALLKRKDPRNAFVALVARGYTPVNCSYLTKALEKLPKEAAQQSPASKQDTTDPYVIELQDEKRRLMVERGKISNQFHDCATDQDRAAVSLVLQERQAEIARVMNRIDYYYEHGKPSQPKELELPEDALLLDKLRRNIASMISRKKKVIRELSQQDEPDTSKLAKAEQSLVDYENKMQHVKDKLKSKGI